VTASKHTLCEPRISRKDSIYDLGVLLNAKLYFYHRAAIYFRKLLVAKFDSYYNVFHSIF
jgi:hypothetical protein